ncbi:hypothetical protein SAMN04487969_102509 [Paenibacillus algorifonticola]|uniref:DUF2213 domain-containing protein n=2 Tax=Paenibacillus algorifonticola TaxID=684063 RepID=A0A1I2AJE7_9BACL|nr:hypothetical protein SAMN04487969_102509 [Paenibacillus algorifonticola]
MDRQVYYGSRFSPNMTMTPNGFLIAHGVPIARTGYYEYLASEIGGSGNDIVKVFRSPEEVFSPAAMASFTAAPVTDDHPSEAVTSNNATRYSRGVVQDVRQGKGVDADLLIADLVIHDETLIKEIKDGKREVSAGYTCNYVDNGDGTYSQNDIRGNHVAVVSAGRAGDRVRINDAEIDPEKRNNQAADSLPNGSFEYAGGRNKPEQTKEEKDKMNKKIVLPRKQRSRVTDILAAIGLKQFAADAEPEEIMDAVETMADEREEGREEEKEKEEAKDADPALAALAEQVAKLTSIVEAIGKKEEPADPLDALESEIQRLQGDDDDPEGSMTIPASEMVDDNEPGPVQDPEDRPESALDNAYMLQALKAIKPILAAIKDPAERKLAADAAIASIKGRPDNKAYAGMMQKRQKPKQTGDSGAKSVDHSELGRKIAEMHNPHYKKQQ